MGGRSFGYVYTYLLEDQPVVYCRVLMMHGPFVAEFLTRQRPSEKVAGTFPGKVPATF